MLLNEQRRGSFILSRTFCFQIVQSISLKARQNTKTIFFQMFILKKADPFFRTRRFIVCAKKGSGNYDAGLVFLLPRPLPAFNIPMLLFEPGLVLNT